MNDNETKVMTFSNVSDLSLTLSTDGSVQSFITPIGLISGAQISGYSVTPRSGRIFFAGMMFDRLRFRSVSVTLRPKVMPSSSATNYIVYAAWDRYGGTSDVAKETNYSIRTDPSAKQVVWTPGGSGTPLRTWIYATSRDRFQYFNIQHSQSLIEWTIGGVTVPQESSVFFPVILLNVEAVTSTSTSVQFTIHTRMTVEFQGGYSNTTLNYTPPTRGLAAANNVMTPEDIPNSQPDESAQYLAQQFQRMQTALPAVSRR